MPADSFVLARERTGHAFPQLVQLHAPVKYTLLFSENNFLSYYFGCINKNALLCTTAAIIRVSVAACKPKMIILFEKGRLSLGIQHFNCRSSLKLSCCSSKVCWLLFSSLIFRNFIFDNIFNFSTKNVNKCDS